jgi:hypothetical protein
VQGGWLGQVSRTRALIEAYASPPDRGHGAPEQADERGTEDDRDAALRHAFDFVDDCVRGIGERERATHLSDVAALEVAAAPETPEPRHMAWRVPRGLLYWLSIGAAASIAWRLTTSVLLSAIAALAASAVIILLELVLRMINPRFARRLGLAAGRSDAAMFAAAALFGIGAGVAIAYLV